MKVPEMMQAMKDNHKDIQSGLCKSMGMMFERVANEKDLIDFSLLFFKSDVYGQYLDDWTIFSQSPLYVLQLFKEELEAKGMDYEKDIPEPVLVDTDAAYWLGFIVAYWHLVRDFDFSALSKEDCQCMFDNYDSLHTQSCEYVYELYKDERLGKIGLETEYGKPE